MDPLRVLIADDHPVFRNGMHALIASLREMEVAGEATTGDEVVMLAASLQPDVILMDLKMPGISGIEASRRILDTSPHIRILMVTMFEDDESVFAALRAGARVHPQGLQPKRDHAGNRCGWQRRGDLQSGDCAAAARLLCIPAPGRPALA
jgi:CheY-like chemotaxis protein